MTHLSLASRPTRGLRRTQVRRAVLVLVTLAIAACTPTAPAAPPAPLISDLALTTPTATQVAATFAVDWNGGSPGSCSISVANGPTTAGSCSSLTLSSLAPGETYLVTVTATSAAGRSSTADGQIATPGRQSITSYDRMAPGAPHLGYFLQAWQSFTAASNTITFIGVTVGSSTYQPGEQLHIRVCSATDPTNGCAGTTYVDTYATIQNYGNTSVDVGDVPVTPGQSYFVVWSQPAGRDYVTYWWAGGTTITTSDQMQMIVQGYNR